MSDTYTIKSLEWSKLSSINTGTDDLLTMASVCGGIMLYSIERNGGKWKWSPDDNWTGGRCKSLEAGKAASEKHWRKLIKQALEKSHS